MLDLLWYGIALGLFLNMIREGRRRARAERAPYHLHIRPRSCVPMRDVCVLIESIRKAHRDVIGTDPVVHWPEDIDGEGLSIECDGRFRVSARRALGDTIRL